MAARLILEGFIAYGWTYRELMRSETTITRKIASYVNISELAQQCNTEVLCGNSSTINAALPTPVEGAVGSKELTSDHYGLVSMVSGRRE